MMHDVVEKEDTDRERFKSKNKNVRKLWMIEEEQPLKKRSRTNKRKNSFLFTLKVNMVRNLKYIITYF